METENIKNYFLNKNILITGGLGFIGKNLVRKLIKFSNCQITIIDDCSNGKIEDSIDLLDKVNFIQTSAYNINNYENEIRKAHFIYHLACVQISHSSKEPLKDLEVNAGSTLKLLEYLKNNKHSTNLERFIYTSTASVYGSPSKLPISEEDPINIMSHYAATKYLAENYTMIYNLLYDIPTTIIRFSNVFGYGQTPLNPYCGVIGKFIHNGLEGKEITIIGDGEQTRDYTFIEDALNAILLASLNPKAIGNIFNIATNIETSINQLVLIIKEQISNLKITYIPERDIDNVRKRVMNIAKAQKMIGWTPNYNLKYGIEKTIEWYRNYLQINKNNIR